MGITQSIMLGTWCIATYALLKSNPKPSPKDGQRQRQIKILRELYGFDYAKRNIAFAGTSGIGKSTMINSLRGLKEGDEGAAKCDYDECTMEVARYPLCSHIDLWDLPGAGTVRHPSAGYFDDKHLFIMDAIVIVVRNRLSEIDMEIARRARNERIPYFFVRNLVEEAKKKDPEMRQKIVKRFEESFKDLQVKPKLYLVNAHAFSDNAFDEKVLAEEVLKNIVYRK
ncbi:hypothetical protein AKO1_014435 [Acrasis kona]|uniref:IRG-type G domain-containing protein n=1 Tax=Acrasis kona TaxID=1008807 RepID=A0AAW2Z0H3_9EUKA